MGFLSRFKDGLKKTKQNIVDKIDNVLSSYDVIDENLFEELEETLILSDVGINTSQKICMDLKTLVQEKKVTDPKLIRDLLYDYIYDLISGEQGLKLYSKPSIVLVIGVNGVGKTTTIGKLAVRFKKAGKKVLLAAGDTFRAAAIEQLEIWAQRSDTDIVKQMQGSDSASVIYDAICSAKAKNTDIVICDTAGRLHNKKNLMAELAKINKVIDRELPNADKEILLVLDATTGQNAINQAKEFNSICNITGIILTKVDGTAKGGIVLSIKNDLNIPVKFLGMGEQINDLQPFNPKAFAIALFDPDKAKEEEWREYDEFGNEHYEWKD